MKHMLFAPAMLLSITISVCLASPLLALTDYDAGSLVQKRAIASGSGGVFSESMGFEQAGTLTGNNTSITWNSELERQGVVLGLMGLYQEAYKKFEEALQLNPEQSSVLAKIGDILYYTGKIKESEDYYNLAVHYDQNNRFAHQRLGLIFESKGNFQDAIKHYEKGLIGATDRYLGTRLNLAQCYILVGRYNDAVTLLEKYKNLPIFTNTANLVLASAYLGAQQHEQAIQIYTHFISEEPNSIQALTSLGIAYRIIGNKDKSLFYLDEALKNAPNDSLALFQRAETFRAHGNIPDSIRDYLNIESGWPRNAANQRLINIHNDANTKEMLDIEINNILQTSSNSAIFLRSAVIYFETGQMEKALSILEQLTTKFANDPTALFEAGSMFAAFKQYARARETYQSALIFSPADEKILKALIMVHMREKNNTEAINLTNKLISDNQYNESNYIFAATILQDASRTDLAIPLYETVIKNNPENIIALNNMASILTLEKNYSRAIFLAKKAYELAKNSSSVQDTLGWALVQEGKPSEGIKYLQEAINHNSENPVYLFHFGYAKEAISKGTGIEYLKKALQTSLDFPGSEEARRILELHPQ